jgi:hypothetical protein
MLAALLLPEQILRVRHVGTTDAAAEKGGKP